MYTNTEELKETIKQDCITFESMINEDRLLHYYMYLDEMTSSKESGLYKLILNGHELWYGTLEEINAIVKSMIIRLEHSDFLDE